jgi:hypothetical protein
VPSPWRTRRRWADPRPVTPDPLDDDRVIWYRGPDGDHAFGVSTGYLRSKCKAVRWDVRLHAVEGTVRPCTGCLAVIEPLPVAAMPEGEARAMDGNR